MKENFSVESTRINGPLSLWGVFDGHGGTGAALFAQETLFVNLVKNLSKNLEVSQALTNAFLETDGQFLASSDVKDKSGTTALCALLEHDTGRLWVANAGDSRAVLCRRGAAVPLSWDHKPTRPEETKRIQSAGGFVIGKRVMGELAVSRALGDRIFKAEEMRLITASPEVHEEVVGKEDSFLLLACDGVYDVVSNKEVIAFVGPELVKADKLMEEQDAATTKQPDQPIATPPTPCHSLTALRDRRRRAAQRTVERLVCYTIHDCQSTDNVSALLIRFSVRPPVQGADGDPQSDPHIALKRPMRRITPRELVLQAAKIALPPSAPASPQTSPASRRSLH